MPESDIQRRPIAFARRFQRNTIYFGIPFFVLGILFDLPMIWARPVGSSIIKSGIINALDALCAALIYTVLEHWYGRLRSRHRGQL
jgi:hypothetical protein